MKKTLLVLALAVVLVLAFASSAFAYQPSPVYIAWDGTGVNSNGPHADYQAATTKCAVCHSVHAAPVNGSSGTVPAPWTSTTPTQLLLRSDVANSCKYCHIDTSIGGVQLYGGPAGGIYGVWVGPGHSGTGGSACANCHAVHGANTFLGANQSKIIRLTPNSRDPQPEVVGDTAHPANAAVLPLFDTMANAKVSGMKYQQQTVFCSSCHPNFSTSADATIGRGAGYYYNDASAANLAKAHSMVATVAANFSATTGGTAKEYTAGDAALSTQVTQNSGATISGMGSVSSNPDPTCRSCHTAGGVTQAGITFNSFPHYTRGYPYFLMGGAAADTGVTGNTGTPVNVAADGNCLLCHAMNATTTGVGHSF